MSLLLLVQLFVVVVSRMVVSVSRIEGSRFVSQQKWQCQRPSGRGTQTDDPLRGWLGQAEVSAYHLSTPAY